MEADGNGKSGGLARFERRILEERGIKGSKLQVEISTRLRPQVPCVSVGTDTHTHTLMHFKLQPISMHCAVRHEKGLLKWKKKKEK